MSCTKRLHGYDHVIQTVDFKSARKCSTHRGSHYSSGTAPSVLAKYEGGAAAAPVSPLVPSADVTAGWRERTAGQRGTREIRRFSIRAKLLHGKHCVLCLKSGRLPTHLSLLLLLATQQPQSFVPKAERLLLVLDLLLLAGGDLAKLRDGEAPGAGRVGAGGG